MGVDNTVVSLLNVFDLNQRLVNIHHERQATETLHLVIHLETSLDHADHHVRNETNSLLDGSRLGPSRRSRLFVQDTLVQHLNQDFIVDLVAIVMEDFRRANAPSPHLIFWGTVL